MPFCTRNVGDVAAPHLVGTGHCKFSQQVGIDTMSRMSFAGIRFRVDAEQPHLAHQSLNALAVDHIPMRSDKEGHFATAIKRRFEILLVEQSRD